MFDIRSNNCHHCARECARLGRMTSDPELRHDLFDMARQWMALAMEEEHEPAGEPLPERA